LERVDRWLAPRVDGIVTVGDRLAARYRAMGGRVWIVHNTQPLPDMDVLDVRGRAYRRSLGVPDDALLVTYVGFLNPERLLTPLLEAVPDVANVWCAIGGTGPNLPQVQDAAARCDRIRALGWVPLADVPTVIAASDVVYYGLDARNQNAYYFMPNLSFFALAAGRPVLTTPVGEIAEVVRQEQCGVVLESATSDAVRDALHKLCEPVYRATLTRYARYSGQERYHWAYAATHLLEAYCSLTDVRNCQEIV
jgi:glycosyltransferase involved in cell wall biosynthesis